MQRLTLVSGLACVLLTTSLGQAHGTVVYPVSRVYRVYKSNPWNPNFALARRAVQIDGTLSYYTWNELSRNIPEAVKKGLPKGFDYSKWVPDGTLASGGRVDKNSKEYPRTYKGLDQVSADWPTTPLLGGSTITVRFLATAPHDPSVWDVWMTKPGWKPTQALAWKHMEYLGRPVPKKGNREYTFPLRIPTDRTGHHVLWIAWQRNDPAGEVFFSTSDILIQPRADFTRYGVGCAGSNKLVPTLANLNRPVVGQTFALEADRLAAGSTALLLFGRKASLPLGTLAPGCTLLTTPDAIQPLGRWGGSKIAIRLPIPADPKLFGVRVGMQLAALDPKLTHPLPVALSRGGEARLGVQ